jgi:hypothetical protein
MMRKALEVWYMICDKRERLVAEFQVAMENLTTLAPELKVSKDLVFVERNERINAATAASAELRLALRDHMEEHHCWTQSASSLLLLWHAPAPLRATTTA